MSGRIDAADELNMELIREGITLYKKNQVITHNSFPVFPMGHMTFTKTGCQALGLNNPSLGKMILVVWNTSVSPETAVVPLGKYLSSIKSIQITYPSVREDGKFGDVLFSYLPSSKNLSIKFSKGHQARYFEIRY